MMFDFSKPITAYEFWAIVLSILALLIPVFKFLYNKYLKQIKIDFLPSGKITLLYNKSGSYVTLGGVYDTQNKPATIKDISAKIVRESDRQTLSLTWSVFPSPVFRQVAGNYETSFETAHAFKADSDTLTPAFIEFASKDENMNEKFAKILDPLFRAAYMIPSSNNMSPYEFDQRLRTLPEFHKAELDLNECFFWKTGDYTLHLDTRYNDRVLEKKYRFSISDAESNTLRENIQTILVGPVIQKYNFNIPMNTVYKEFEEISTQNL